MKKPVTLTNFTPSQLIFDEQETREILLFIFSSKSSIARSMKIDNQTKSFAQALLLEAVDASYSLGFVEALTSAIARPNVTISKILKKFGQKAAKHWFRHARAADLLKIEIYEIVRRDLEWSFGRIFLMYNEGLAMHSKYKQGWIAVRSIQKKNLVRV